MGALFEISGFNIYMQIAVTLLSLGAHLLATRGKPRQESVVELAAIYMIGLSGWFGIMSGLFGHIIYADEVAAGIGWPLDSGFQMELGFAAIGIGLIGFLGFWRREMWLPFILAKSTFMWGAGLTHILHQLNQGNFSPSNTGVVVWWDFLFPLVLIGVYAAWRRQR